RFLGVTFWAPFPRVFVPDDCFRALERLTAFSTTVLVGRHVHTPDQMVPMKSRLPIQPRNAAECRKRWANEKKSWESQTPLDKVVPRRFMGSQHVEWNNPPTGMF